MVLLLAAPAQAATKVVVTGHGWGHGVGMSQWGAYGYALHGWTYDQIVSHYYTGTELGKAPAARDSLDVAVSRGEDVSGVAHRRSAAPGDLTAREQRKTPR